MASPPEPPELKLQRQSTIEIAREELNRKCCFIRMQYHPITRTTLWWLFVSVFAIPYLLTSIALFLPFHRRTIDNQKSILFQIGISLLYTVFCLPCIALFDLYICTRLIITDLSTTRYFLYYWRLKTFVELVFEAIPQTVLLICIGVGLLDDADSDSSNINVQMLYGSLTMSILFLIWYCMVIYYGAQSTGLSVYDYVYKYYIMQGMDMIPYQEAITQNLLSDFILTSENLTSREWTHLTTDLFCNFSIVKFDISGQQHLEFSLWLKLFECLGNNNLTTLKLRDCFIFHPANILPSQKPKERKERFSWSQKERKERRRKTVMEGSLANENALKAGLQALIFNVTSLVVVDLTNNCLGTVFKAMIKPISKLKKLKELYLANNRLSETELSEHEFLMIFRGCVSLTLFDLSDNGLNDEDINMICNAIQTCKEKNKQLDALTKIKLDANKISIEGANKLLGILTAFRRLSITLQKNDISDDLFADMQSRSAINILINDDDDSSQ